MRTSFFKRIASRYIGDKGFYKGVILLVLPIVAQQGITNFVNLLDNVMVGGLCTESISGVAIANQLIFVFNLTLFGGFSGASIYGAQYAGINDNEGVRYAFRFKLLLGVLLSTIAIVLFSIFGETLISLYLNDATNEADSLAMTLKEAKDYLSIALWGLVPFMISQCYGSTLREIGETLSPMIASLISLLVNLGLNYVLIYGHLGFPALGVRGAAIATVIARYSEIAYLLIYVYVKRRKYPFVNGALKSLYIPIGVFKNICITGAPLLLNEFMWSVGTALINQAYSIRGLQTVAAVNITSTVFNVFAIVMFSMGSAISIMVGQQLGSGDVEGAKDTDRKLLFLDIAIHIAIGLIIIALSGLIPQIYKIEPEVRALTSNLLVIAGLSLPLHAFVHGTYFTLRSGGRTVITFLFDSVFTWVVSLPLAFILCNYTGFNVVIIYACLQMSDIIKIFIAIPMLKSGTWARRIIL
ncbi:MAG: MATE family efflux transporter [Clostridia bacterium]